MASISKNQPTTVSVVQPLSNVPTATDEKKMETTHMVMEVPSRDSTASASNEKCQRLKTGSTTGLPSAADVSTPQTPESARVNPFDTDIEAMITQTSTKVDSTCNKKANHRCGNTACDVWPTQGHWKKKAKEAKIARSCTCLSRLSKRNRLIAKILIGILFLGIAVAVGFGVSKPLGASIWKPSKQ